MSARTLRHVLPVLALGSLIAASAALGDGGTEPKPAPNERADVRAEIASLASSSGARGTVAEYGAMRQLALQPKMPVANAAPTSSELVGERGSHVLADGPAGRLVAVSAKDGSGLCTVHSLPDALGLEPTASCNGELDAHGLLVTVGGNREHRAVFGLAADDVSSVIVERESGVREPARMDGNAYLWSSDLRDPAVAVIAHRGGSQHRVELPAPAEGSVES